MNNFIFHNPTKVIFGQGMLEQLTTELSEAGQNILIVYGGGSIKRTGLYDQVTFLLENAGKRITELSGIMPNPRTEKVYEGIELCKKNNCDFILAVGGGSVVDCAKAIAAGVHLKEDFWAHLFLDRNPLLKAIPLGVILTMSATGSEMNGNSVISNWIENLKIGYQSPLLFPQFSILDPTLTMTMPREQVVFGAIDMISHVFEQYFSPPDDNNLTDDLCEALLQNIRLNLDGALQDLKDYEARSNLMWSATLAINGILRPGKEGDWQAHKIEHALSAWFDIPHGAGLAIIYPNLLHYIRHEAQDKLVRFAIRVCKVLPGNKSKNEIALEGLKRLRAYFSSLGAPQTLADVGIPETAFEGMADTTELLRTGYKPLGRDDVLEILKLSK
jgi:alcohol dehydrogenase YqhD (iron-dependent ADH family)